jgi:hypothetical protein
MFCCDGRVQVALFKVVLLLRRLGSTPTTPSANLDLRPCILYVQGTNVSREFPPGYLGG